MSWCRNACTKYAPADDDVPESISSGGTPFAIRAVRFRRRPSHRVRFAKRLVTPPGVCAQPVVDSRPPEVRLGPRGKRLYAAILPRPDPHVSGPGDFGRRAHKYRARPERRPVTIRHGSGPVAAERPKRKRETRTNRPDRRHVQIYGEQYVYLRVVA